MPSQELEYMHLGDKQDRNCREAKGAHRRPGVGVAEPWEQEREEGRGERRPGARARALRKWHRA